MYVAELAAMYERNAERFTSTRGEKEAVITAYDTLVKSPEDRKRAKGSKEPRRCCDELSHQFLSLPGSYGRPGKIGTDADRLQVSRAPEKEGGEGQLSFSLFGALVVG